MSAISQLTDLPLHVGLLCIACTAATQCLVAIWAAESNVHWFWRALGIWAAVFLLVPVRAYQPAIVFAITLPVTAFVVNRIRIVCRRPAIAAFDRVADPLSNIRFSLADVFLAMIVLGLSLATLLHVARRMPRTDWYELAAPACAIAAIATTCWLVFVLRRRIVGLSLLTATVPLASLLVWPIARWLYEMDFVGMAIYHLMPSRELFVRGLMTTAVGAAGVAVIIISALALVRVRPRSEWSKWLLRFVQITLATASLGPLLLLYGQMLVLAPFPSMTIAQDDRSARILTIADRVRELNPSDLSLVALKAGDPQSPTGDELAALYDEVVPLLNATNSMPFDPATDSARRFFDEVVMNRIQSARRLTRCLDAEAIAAKSRGDHDRSLELTMANLRLGIMMCRNSIDVEAMVGHAIMTVANAQLVRGRESLTAHQAKMVTAALSRAESEHEPIEAIIERDIAFTARALGWQARLSQIMERLFVGPPNTWGTPKAMQEMRTRWKALNHLLITDLAVRRFTMETGSLPQSLGELVPAYLNESPLDPYSHQTLVYRPLGGDFTLYSIGQDQHDNGGRFANWTTQFAQAGYDFDLDTLTRP